MAEVMSYPLNKGQHWQAHTRGMELLQPMLTESASQGWTLDKFVITVANSIAASNRVIVTVTVSDSNNSKRYVTAILIYDLPTGDGLPLTTVREHTFSWLHPDE